jgi:hypothetical protein
MKRILKRITQLTVATALLGLATVYALSEIGPEVVTVETFAPDGTPVSTRLWIVDAGGHPWLQAALPWAEDWVHRMEARPRVVVHRVTGVREFDAVLVREPEAAERVQALMRAKYGLRDLLVTVSGLVKGTVPIRLDPVPVAGGSKDRVAAEAAQAEEPTGPTAARWRARALDETAKKP